MGLMHQPLSLDWEVQIAKGEGEGGDRRRRCPPSRSRRERERGAIGGGGAPPPDRDRDSKDFSSNSLRDDRSESFESVLRAAEKGEPKKKSSRWSKAWNIWGFIYRRGHSRGDGGGHASVERSFSESWPELREQVHNGKIFRCNSSVSSRNYLYNNAGSGSMRRSNVETDGHGKKRNGEFVLERNRSARYSPSHLENGMLRFYLTPMRRNGSSGKGRHSNTNSFTRTMLGIY